MRYVAANTFACESLGYTREEHWGMRVTGHRALSRGTDESATMVVAGDARRLGNAGARKDDSELVILRPGSAKTQDRRSRVLRPSIALARALARSGDRGARALAGTHEGGAHEVPEERRRPRRARLELGVELAGHEPRMVAAAR